MPRLSGQQIQLDPDAFAVQTSTGVKEALDRLVEKVKRERFQAIEQEAQNHREQFAADAIQIIEQAKAQAQEIIESASAQRDSLEEEGRAKGYEVGYLEGVTQAQADTAEMLQRSQALMQSAFHAESERLAQLTPDIALILQTLVQRLWQHSFQNDPHLALANLVTTAVDALMLTGKMTVVLHPETLRILQQQPNQIQEALAGLSERIQWQSDPLLDAETVFISGTNTQDDQKRLWQIDITHQLETLLPKMSHTLQADLADMADSSTVD
jgi:flagellar biosynthesis/type III secretory pathway protein FliH